MIVACLAVVLAAPAAVAQEVVGRRLFSDTLVLNEPFVEDELSLPSLLHIRRPSPALATEIGVELKKRITSDLELSITGGVTHLETERGAVTGLDDLELELKYQFLRDADREAVGSFALRWEVAGTGRAAIGAEPFHTVTPQLLFGKGLGDLPEPLRYLRPLAVTTSLGVQLPASRTASRALEWGFAVEYSLPYLQSHVRHLGLPPPLDRLMPIVELSGETVLDRGEAGRTTAAANVGAIWVGDAVQVGAEAVVPLNERSGKTVGIRAFLRLSLDEIFGGRFGKPLF